MYLMSIVSIVIKAKRNGISVATSQLFMEMREIINRLSE
jgi:hypothetical protein